MEIACGFRVAAAGRRAVLVTPGFFEVMEGKDCISILGHHAIEDVSSFLHRVRRDLGSPAFKAGRTVSIRLRPS